MSKRKMCQSINPETGHKCRRRANHQHNGVDKHYWFSNTVDEEWFDSVPHVIERADDLDVSHPVKIDIDLAIGLTSSGEVKVGWITTMPDEVDVNLNYKVMDLDEVKHYLDILRVNGK